MAGVLQVSVLTPERVVLQGAASMVVCRTVAGGEIAFLAGHVPFLGALEPGPVRVLMADGARAALALDGGFVHLRADQVTILATEAEPVPET